MSSSAPSSPVISVPRRQLQTVYEISDSDSSTEKPVLRTEKFAVDLDTTDDEYNFMSATQSVSEESSSLPNNINEIQRERPRIIPVILLSDSESDLDRSTNKREENEAKKNSLKRSHPETNFKKKKKLKKISNYSKYNDEYSNSEVYNSSTDDDDDENSSTPRGRVIEFLDTAPVRDLLLIKGMSAKKMSLIQENRPFTTWDTVVEKFKSVKGLHCSLLNGVSDYLSAQDIMDNLLSKCEKLSCQTEANVSRTDRLVAVQPRLLNRAMRLTEHQMIGLNWLIMMKRESLNSILADEMGLGKTIQIIAFLAYLKENDLILPGKPHLVVVPSSTLDNWRSEFEKWCPSLNVFVYYGNQEERKYQRVEWFKNGFGDTEVVLTTYSCCTSVKEEKKMFRIKPFNCIIFDEAHKLKNMNTAVYEALFSFNGKFKILLTGTPLQNNLLELVSLLVFLMPNLFSNKLDKLKILLPRSLKSIEESSSYEKERASQIKHIIDPFMLRRLKEDVLKNLPKKTTTVEKCKLTDDQRMKYIGVLQDFKYDMELKDNNCYMTYFMLLRKLSNHPLLLRYHFTEDKIHAMAVILARDPEFKGKNVDHICEDFYFLSDYDLHCLCLKNESLKNLNYQLPDELFLRSGKFEFLTPTLNALKKNGHRVIIFSQFIQMLDILEKYCRICEFQFRRMDGSTQTEYRQELIDEYNSDRGIFIFLLSTKAGGLGINLTSADTVILHDLDFNPYNDKQAEDRCHRIGQNRPVKVLKLVSEDTVEEGILDAATRKLGLEKEVMERHDTENSDSKTILHLLKENLQRLSST